MSLAGTDALPRPPQPRTPVAATIVGDFADPCSWLASRRLDQLQASGNNSITWTAVETDDLLSMTGRRLGEAAALQVAGQSSPGEHVPGADTLVVNSRAATSAYAEAQADGTADAMRRALFEALWDRARKISDTEVIRSIVFAVENPAWKGSAAQTHERIDELEPLVDLADNDILAGSRRLGYIVSGSGGPLTGEGQRHIDRWQAIWRLHGRPPLPIVIIEPLSVDSTAEVINAEAVLGWLSAQLTAATPMASQTAMPQEVGAL